MTGIMVVVARKIFCAPFPVTRHAPLQNTTKRFPITERTVWQFTIVIKIKAEIANGAFEIWRRLIPTGENVAPKAVYARFDKAPLRFV